MSSFLLVIEIHAIKFYLDLPRSREKWLKMAVFAWLRVEWRSYGVLMVYND